MNRLRALVFAAFLLGPQVGAVLHEFAGPGVEERGCCVPEAACDENCVQCPCCVTRAPSLATAGIEQPLDRSAEQPVIATSLAPLAPPPSDIQHVPKSS